MIKLSRDTLLWTLVAVLSFSLVISVPFAAVAQEKHETKNEQKAEEAKPERMTKDGALKRGADIGDAPLVALADVIKNPKKFGDKTVTFKGTITEVCQKKGCWMKVVTKDGPVGVRVTFKDYGFFVPMDSEGMLVRAEGLFHTKLWSKEDVDHLEGEGAHLVRNADGSATELGFIATGVELKKAKKPAETEEKPKS